jgi:hypothetical protein
MGCKERIGGKDERKECEERRGGKDGRKGWEKRIVEKG